MVEMAMRIDEKSIRSMGAVSDGARLHRVNCRALARAAPSVPNGGVGAGEPGPAIKKAAGGGGAGGEFGYATAGMRTGRARRLCRELWEPQLC